MVLPVKYSYVLWIGCLLFGCIQVSYAGTPRLSNKMTREEIYQLAKTTDTAKDSINYLEYLLKQRAGASLAMKNKLQQEAIQQKIQEKKNTQLLTAGVITVTLLMVMLILSRYFHFRRSKRQEEELTKGYADISEKNTALKSLDEFKNKLITIIANDFREPLQQITTVADELSSGHMSREEMLTAMRRIGESSHRTLEVFENVLRWIKLQLAGYVYTPGVCKVGEVMEQVIPGVFTPETSSSLSVVDRIPDDTEVYADYEMLQFVSRHILIAAHRNAVADSLIIMDAWPDEHLIYISVAIDVGKNGTDIAEGMFAWQRDIRALGMAVSRDFAIRMRGDIQVEAGGDRYITITLALPVAL
ncbi:MAG: HAMP domain-containing histidine kinase [Chitinophaga sp.]|uniref:sensor histidine kinase n=1 Tax=Chitinophaga sp. TaxID=1869181 RepID=UPI0025BD5469|nr:hypothetical protein [Chitinophaga sp.]MBV8255721.1 HAMP domain-containing histidine kinase [Chitinophaga sp.]